MVAPPNKLPDSLTRLLDTSAARSFAPTPGDRARSEKTAPPADPAEPLNMAVLRGVVLTTAGLVWAAILWLILRHVLE
ncbi:MAG: hypothetical protein INR70_04765 [Parafilimonas terrae]|nr:hypothetical protein [Parafilimonas terrae]